MPSYALIADPDPGQAQVYRHLALAEGFEVKVVRDGEEAMASVASRTTFTSMPSVAAMCR